jgi:O-antigen/teichoic acid export membrane protein
MADQTVTAGRGVVYIALAKLYFMVAGIAINFILPRLLKSEVLYGNYQLVIGLISVIDNVIVTATIQAVSKFTAPDESQADAVKRAAIKMQLLLGGGLAIAYIAAAPLLARWEKDASLTHLYQLSTGIMLCYSLYAVFVGSLNGLRRFGGQATLDASFSTLRCLLILGATAMGAGLWGAVGGFVAAAAIILVAATAWVGLPKGAGRFPAARIWSFMAQLFVYTLALNLIMRVDLFLLKRFAADLSGAADAAAGAKIASTYSAFYSTAQLFAFIPYQAILAVAFVIFPLISRTTFEGDRAATQSYIRQTLRLSLIFVAGLAVVFMANPEAVIGVPYQPQYRVGGPALRILSVGMIFFSLFTVLNTILNSAGRTWPTILSGVLTLAASAGANTLLVPRASSLEQAMVLAAYASMGAMALGALLSTFFLHRSFAASFSPLTVLRVVLAVAAGVGVGWLLPERSKIVTLAECCLVLAAYLAVLVATRELRGQDLATFARVLRRKRS